MANPINRFLRVERVERLPSESRRNKCKKYVESLSVRRRLFASSGVNAKECCDATEVPNLPEFSQSVDRATRSLANAEVTSEPRIAQEWLAVMSDRSPPTKKYLTPVMISDAIIEGELNSRAFTQLVNVELADSNLSSGTSIVGVQQDHIIASVQSDIPQDHVIASLVQRDTPQDHIIASVQDDVLDHFLASLQDEEQYNDLNQIITSQQMEVPQEHINRLIASLQNEFEPNHIIASLPEEQESFIIAPVHVEVQQERVIVPIQIELQQEQDVSFETDSIISPICDNENIQNQQEDVSHIENVSFETDSIISPIRDDENIQQFCSRLSTPSQSSRKKRTVGSSKDRNVQKGNRLLGKEYTGLTTSPHTKNKKKMTKGPKVLKHRCSHGEPGKKSHGFSCSLVSDDSREHAMTEFWELPTWLGKKTFIRGLVVFRKGRGKNATKDCFMTADNEHRVKVCRRLFLSTFDIGRDQFMRWTGDKNGQLFATTQRKKRSVIHPSASSDLPVDITENIDNRRKVAEEWIDDVPKVPSHYCRASSSRVYVQADWESLSAMHREYTKNCESKQTKPICRQVFAEILEAKKISIHQPRKDQCDICTGHANESIAEDVYETHLIKKDEARMAKNEAKSSASDTKVVVTMDLQSVLLCPRIKASAAYYKRKLQVHNFTMWRLNDDHVHLYVWDETNGNVGASEFSTCVADYIQRLPERVNHVVLISDGCCGQNRNSTLSTCLRDLSIKRKIVIEQLFLEKGHTMMEADAAHSLLERKFNAHNVYAPQDYLYLMRQTRPEKPFEVEEVKFSFFENFDKPTSITSIRPGTLYNKCSHQTSNFIVMLLYFEVLLCYSTAGY